ncbi:MAG: hypothetical protein QOE54_1561 [Streptosporangiaceae bacterium]|jgi:hypothetical protein|nr:hypothetical protein [Streptosporangiaceae bacterium]
MQLRPAGDDPQRIQPSQPNDRPAPDRDVRQASRQISGTICSGDMIQAALPPARAMIQSAPR